MSDSANGAGGSSGATAPKKVRKRDGRLEAYDPETIRRSLLRLVEGGDGRAQEWVQSWWEAFEAQLRRREEATLTALEIHRILYEIIAASGQAQLAERWFAYARRKERLRARIAAQPQRLPGLEAARERGDRPVGFVRAEWLARLVQAGVAEDAAETISRELAAIVIGLDPEIVTEWLIAALLRSLCLARGISALPADLPLTGVTTAELDASFSGAPGLAQAAAAGLSALASLASVASVAGSANAANATGGGGGGGVPWLESWALERFYAEEVRFFHRMGYWRLGLTEHPWSLWALRVDTHRIAVQASRQASPEGCGLMLARILCGLCDWTAETVTAQGVGDFIHRSYSQDTLRAAALRAFCLALAALPASHAPVLGGALATGPGGVQAGLGGGGGGGGPSRGDRLRPFGRPPAKLVLRVGTPQRVAADEALLKQMYDLGFDQFAGGVELELPPRAMQRQQFQTCLFAAFNAGMPIRLTAARPAELFQVAPVGIRLNADVAATAAGALRDAAGSADRADVDGADSDQAPAGAGDWIDWAHEFFDTNADDLVWALEAHRHQVLRALGGTGGAGGASGAGGAGGEAAGATRFTQWAQQAGVLGYFQGQKEWTLPVMPAGLPDPLAGGGWDPQLWQKLAGLQERFAGWWQLAGGAPGAVMAAPTESAPQTAATSPASPASAPNAPSRARGRRFVVAVMPEETTGFGEGWPAGASLGGVSGGSGAGVAGGDGSLWVQGWPEASLDRLPGLLKQYAERAKLCEQTAPLNLVATQGDPRMALEDGKALLEFLAETWPQANVRILSPAMLAAEAATRLPRERFGRVYELEPLRLALEQRASAPKLF